MPSQDPATWSSASFDPDISGEIDSPLDLATEKMAEMWGNKPVPPSKTLFLRAAAEMHLYLEKTSQNAGWSIGAKELLAKALAEILSNEDPVLIAKCIDIASGCHVLGGITETKIGADHGITKAKVSQHVKDLNKFLFDGVPAAGMKSVQAVEKYRNLRRGRTARHQCVDWIFAKVFTHEKRRNHKPERNRRGSAKP